MTITYELPATHQKSFYGKAHVIVSDDNKLYLQSYDTIVARIDRNGFHRLWNGWSATTAKHINAFLTRYAGMVQMWKLSKAEWEALPVESTFNTVDDINAFCND